MKPDYRTLNCGFLINPYRFGTAATFSDDYTTNSGWTQVGTTITVNSGVGGKAAAVSTLDNAGAYIHKSLGVTLSDSLWYANFEFERDTAGTNSFFFVVSAGTALAFNATQDMLGVVADTGDIRSCAKDGAAAVTNGTFMALTTDVNYFCRLERTTTTNLKLSVFSDSARTTHITGSPQNQTIGATIGSLTHLQHGSRTDGGGGASSWRIDNTNIYNGVAP